MQCPRCGSDHMQVVYESDTDTKGFGAGKGCLGYLLFGPIGLLCGLCGMGESRTKSRSYWVCNQCGNKFKM